MSGKSKNHQGTMKAWRSMAEKRGFKPGRRWRWTVRAIVKKKGWCFIDAFLHVYFQGFPWGV